MTDQKPTGVFVPLHEGQLREDQIAKICNPKLTMTESLLAIGTPVQESGLTCIGNIVWFENDREPVLGSYVPAVFKQGSGVPVASLHEAQAQIAARDAEIVRLREALDRIRLVPFPMMDLPAGIMHGIAHKSLKGGAV